MLRRREAFFFLFMTLPIMGHVVLLPPLWKIAGRDAWISTIIALPVGLMIAYFTWKLMNIQPDTTLAEITIKLFGPYVGFVINSIWMIYFFLLGTLTISSLMNMFEAGFYPETPMWFLGASFLALVIYTLIKGIKVVAWAAGVLTLFVTISGHTISLSLTPQRDIRHLLPILEFGLTPAVLGAVLLSAVWTEMFVLAVLRFHRVESKGMLYLLLFGAVANSIMMFSVAAGTVTVFGFEQTNNMAYPVLSSVRMVTLGFIDRFDVYGLMQMTFGSYIRLSLFLHAVVETLPRKLTKKHRKIAVTIVGIIIYITSLFVFQNKLQYSEMIRYYVLSLGLWFLPILYFLRNSIIRKKT